MIINPYRFVSLITFLFRDDFITPESAPLTSPRTAEPGPGNSVILDTNNTLDISGGEIVPNSATTAAGDPRIVENVLYSQLAGMALYGGSFRNYSIFGSSHYSVQIGWAFSVSPNYGLITGFLLLSGGDLRVKMYGVNPFNAGSYSDDVPFDAFFIARSTGMFFVKDDSLIWVDNNFSTAMYPAVIASQGGFAPFGLSTFRTHQLPAPWDTDYGIATERLAGARTAGDTFTHEADCLIEFELTLVPSGLTVDVFFRIQDASNYWRIRIPSTGNLTLAEIVAGVPTNRATASGVLSGGERIVIVCEDEIIKAYYDNISTWTYSSAANFKTETNGELETEGTGGSVSDIISWPRTLSGNAKDALDAVANA